MKLTARVKRISYLTSHAAEVAKEIADSREPMVFTQDGEAKLVVMDVATYEEQQETMALLKILALGSQEIEKGDFRSDEAVFAELDKDDDE
jgi:PHD/YefM family antitoxin component YafN of YafNO toxin-antitoxin module